MEFYVGDNVSLMYLFQDSCPCACQRIREDSHCHLSMMITITIKLPLTNDISFQSINKQHYFRTNTSTRTLLKPINLQHIWSLFHKHNIEISHHLSISLSVCFVITTLITGNTWRGKVNEQNRKDCKWSTIFNHVYI